MCCEVVAMWREVLVAKPGEEGVRVRVEEKSQDEWGSRAGWNGGMGRDERTWCDRVR